MFVFPPLLFRIKYNLFRINIISLKGARTNGNGLLEVEKGVIEEIEANENIVFLEIEYLKYNAKNPYIPINIHGNSFWVLIKLMASLKNNVKIRASLKGKGENY